MKTTATSHYYVGSGGRRFRQSADDRASCNPLHCLINDVNHIRASSVIVWHGPDATLSLHILLLDHLLSNLRIIWKLF